MINVVFAGGGTGGHVFPIKSLIECILDNKDFESKINKIYWFGTKNSLEEKICKDIDNPNVYYMSIMSGKIRREPGIIAFLKNLLDMFFVLLGIFQSMFFLIRYKTNVIFCKGGYVAVPVVIAGRILRIPILLHESDAVPGLANKLASKFAKIKYTGFEGVFKNSRQVGQILSIQLTKFNENELDLSGFDMSKTNVILIGGSQGAKTIYEAVYEILDLNKELQEKMNFFVVLGVKNFDLKEKFQKIQNLKTFDFLSQPQMGFLLNKCDLSITRGSATSVAEQLAFGLKTIIVPLPYTGGNHQYYNGVYFRDNLNQILTLQDYNMKDNLENHLKSFIGYKKSSFILPDLDANKKIIINDIISFSKN